MEFKSPIELVKQFNKSFGVITKKTPEVLQEEDWSLKAKLMKEELSEYIEACEKSDIVDIADAVIDMQYILSGIVLAHGLQNVFDKLFQEVHDSNMSKLENGKVLRRDDGKVLKGKNYFKPDLNKILENG
jgi:predicted HAD superfamily Cof-like phosphohydrolase|tara:strand:- start:582 stop:971 length:390 start_codon:yes stop_codon:yes gene_type:complete